MAVVALPAAAHAATYNVDTTDDATVAGACATAPCSLRDALTLAATTTADPTNVVNVPAGTYKLDASLGELSVTGPVTITGAGARSTTVDAQGNSRVFDIGDGDVSMSGLTVTGGNGGGTSPAPFAGDGGGIVVAPSSSSTSLTLTDSVVTGNTTLLNGGGIASPGFESPFASGLTIVRSTISGNKVTGGAGEGLGGGIAAFGDLSVTDSTIDGNAVENSAVINQGGGISATTDPSSLVGSNVTVVNSTITSNAVNGTIPGGMGGGIAVPSSSNTTTLDVKNTIVSGNTVDGAAGDCSGIGPITSDHNLSDDANCMFTDMGSKTGDPQLGPLFDNGGETKTREPAAGSPAVDAGTNTGCPTPDQRGVTTPQNGTCDIGAVERIAEPVAVDDTATVAHDASATPVDVLANDTAGGYATKRVAEVAQPAHGAVVLAADGLSLTYQPAAGYCGADSFTYELNGGSQATVSMTVTCPDVPPVAVADAASVARNAGATRIDVLANDTNPDGGPKTVTSASQPSHGTTAVAADGSSVSYTPTKNFCGADSFTYTLNGGSSATVAVDVACPPPSGQLVVSHLRVHLVKGKVVLLLRCRGSAGLRCRGSLTLNSAPGQSRLKSAAVYGQASFNFAAKKTKTVRITAPDSLRKKLRRTHKAIASVVTRVTRTGRSALVARKKITIIG